MRSIDGWPVVDSSIGRFDMDSLIQRFVDSRMGRSVTGPKNGKTVNPIGALKWCTPGEYPADWVCGWGGILPTDSWIDSYIRCSSDLSIHRFIV